VRLKQKLLPWFEPGRKLAFYLEALDRDVRKSHEHPAIGVLLCASKDDEVVEYSLSRTLSPALIAEYQTQLPDKKLLREKLHEFYLQNAPEEEGNVWASCASISNQSQMVTIPSPRNMANIRLSNGAATRRYVRQCLKKQEIAPKRIGIGCW